ncbi:MAG: hypothetical protein EOO82_01470, partial [Oxalobacteraceae bacterium]
MKLAVRPFRRSENPYSLLFGSAVEAAGIDVAEMHYGPFRFPWNAKVIILHWPDDFFFKKTMVKNLIIVLKILRLYFWKRLPGRRLVWVVHNVTPHASHS